MTYPKSLISYLNRVSNVTRNTLKLSPYKTDEVKPSSIVVCDFPSNSMLDLDTLCLHFNGTTSTSAGAVAFPRGIESLIAKISVELNGINVGSCNNLSDLYNMMYNLNMGTDSVGKRKLYQNGGAQVAPTVNDVSKPFAIHNWVGFLGSVQGRVLDLGIIGSMRLHITLEGTNVLVKSALSATESYTLGDLYFTVDSISIDDSVYYQAKNAFLSGGGVVECPFDTYYGSLFNVTSFNQSSRFSVSSGSIDWITACFPKNRSIQEVDATTGQSAYFNYVAKVDDLNKLSDWSFSINNVQMPQFKAKLHDSYPLLLNVMGTANTQDGGINPSITSADVWTEKYWTAAVRTNLLTDPEERTISGLTTLGTNSTIAFESTGVGSYNPENLLVFVKSTSVLRIGANKMLEIVM